MDRRCALTDYEARIVRETPEYNWPADIVAQALARDRLPIDLPATDIQDPFADEVIIPAIAWVLMALAAVIAAVLWVLL